MDADWEIQSNNRWMILNPMYIGGLNIVEETSQYHGQNHVAFRRQKSVIPPLQHFICGAQQLAFQMLLPSKLHRGDEAIRIPIVENA